MVKTDGFNRLKIYFGYSPHESVETEAGCCGDLREMVRATASQILERQNEKGEMNMNTKEMFVKKLKAEQAEWESALSNFSIGTIMESADEYRTRMGFIDFFEQMNKDRYADKGWQTLLDIPDLLGMFVTRFRDPRCYSFADMLTSAETIFEFCNEAINTALYKKLFAEKEEFKNLLLSLPPEAILKNAYEYATLEDILLSFEYNDLPFEDAVFLLGQKNALVNLLKRWENTETDYMKNIWQNVVDYTKDKDGGIHR